MNKNSHNMEDEAEKIAPILFSLKKKNPFEVPEGYFETLPQLVMARCEEEPKPSRKGILLYLWQAKPIAAAASLALLVMFGVRYYNGDKQNTTAVASTDERTAALYLNELDESTLMESVDISGSATTSDPLNKKAAEEYLIDHNVDINQIAY